jgi:hypothetical protein
MSLVRRICLAAGISLLSPSAAHAEGTSDRWTFAVTPYLWLPNVNGTLKYSPPPGGNGAPQVEAGPNNYLENLHGLLLLSGEARNGRWSILSDLIYLDFEGERSSVKAVDFGGPIISTNLNASTRSSLRGLQWMLAGGYTVVQTPKVMLDVLGGFRYFGIEAKSDWQLAATVSGPRSGETFPASGSISRRTDLVDGIVGVRGRFRLGESQWFVPYYLDVGAGSSRLTWQGLLGIAYAFKWGDAVLGYRRLYYDQADNKLLQNFSFSGPTLGATFRF